MQRQVLGLTKRVLGKEHPHTLTSVSNLAGVLGDQGRVQAGRRNAPSGTEASGELILSLLPRKTRLAPFTDAAFSVTFLCHRKPLLYRYFFFLD
jgi:hypothetical protein